MDLLTKWRANPFCGTIVIGGMQHDGTPKQTNGNAFRRYRVTDSRNPSAAEIERMVSFDFIYDLLAPYYPATGRPSVDPVSMFKMLLIGYLYGIKSERRLVEEVQLNIAYRWFCGFELDDTIPNHSTFSKTRTRKWQQSSLFQKAFYEIVKQCIDSGLIDGEAMAADGSYIPANVSRESWINVETEVEQSMQSYLDSLDEELSNQPGFKKPPTKIVRKCRTTSQTDPDSGSPTIHSSTHSSVRKEFLLHTTG